MQRKENNYSNTYESPAVVLTGFVLSLLVVDSSVFIDSVPLELGSNVSLRRPAALFKRTVCARILSLVVFVRFVITLDPGGTPLVLVFNVKCPLLFDVDVSILAAASNGLGTPFAVVPLINE